MKAMILAAGRGNRMRPLTEVTAKPLLQVAGTPIIAYHFKRLAAVGIREIVINVHHCAEQIIQTLGNGSEYGVELAYSIETELLDTGGGISNALPLLDDEPFIVINGDIWIDYPLQLLLDRPRAPHAAHLVLTPNPYHHPTGDFGLDNESVCDQEGIARYTFSGLGVYLPELFRNPHKPVYPLREALTPAIRRGEISGEIFFGEWINVDTPERLQQVRSKFQ